MVTTLFLSLTGKSEVYQPVVLAYCISGARQLHTGYLVGCMRRNTDLSQCFVCFWGLEVLLPTTYSLCSTSCVCGLLFHWVPAPMALLFLFPHWQHFTYGKLIMLVAQLYLLLQEQQAPSEQLSALAHVWIWISFWLAGVLLAAVPCSFGHPLLPIQNS